MALATLFAASCDDASDTAVVAVVNAWTQAGLKSEAFASFKDEKLGASCKKGQVSGLETILCQYPDAEAARAAHPAGLAVVGEATGLALASGKLLLVVADRDQVDSSGRTINQIVGVFRANAPVDEPAAQDDPSKKAAEDKGAGAEKTDDKAAGAP